MDTDTTPSPPQTDGLWKLHSAARAAGLSEHLFVAGIERHEIKGIEIIYLGPRRHRYVRTAELCAWLRQREPAKT